MSEPTVAYWKILNEDGKEEWVPADEVKQGLHPRAVVIRDNRKIKQHQWTTNIANEVPVVVTSGENRFTIQPGPKRDVTIPFSAGKGFRFESKSITPFKLYLLDPEDKK